MTADGARFAFLESNTTGTGRDFCAAARARGLRPVLLTRDPGRYPYVAQDGIDTVLLDTSDPQAVLDACAVLDPAGIATSSEYFVALAASTAAKLGLPGPDADAVTRCRSKDTQRAVHAAAGVPVPEFAAVTEARDAVSAATRIGFPVVVKPVSGSGSVGVRLCADAEETRAWTARLLTDGSATVLVEAAVPGSEFSVETFDGTVVAVVAKHVGPEPYFVETGHDVPAPVPPPVADVLAATAVRAVAALGLGYGAAHTELRLGPGGPVVIEVNPRLAGGMIPVAVRAATGVDLVDAVIARAAGQPAAVPGPAAGHAAVRFVQVAREGRVTAITNLAGAAAAPGVAAASVTTAVGRDVRVTHSFQDRLACVVAAGPDPATASHRATAATALIDITVEETP
ncbi:ATP-grasp domain-containing protein [Streptomyces sp. ISL-86]|uniref:ATP-grasp domain-containing protein n=1 Tax=Streptomyces sp. ISL-86 TaxID=2819187 RepID=UPI001BE4EE8D|nr:ATP-grasp domain-containing protein [Streptomyces sp. ISL-86]MBT2454426.1 ATP-grasp domain-containing protein [Streptomyces sp. ISL-86]